MGSSIIPNDNYECQDCQHVFEGTALIKDIKKGQFSCRKCGSKKTKRLFDGFGYSHGNGSRDNDYNPVSCSTCPEGTCSLGE